MKADKFGDFVFNLMGLGIGLFVVALGVGAWALLVTVVYGLATGAFR